MTASSYRPHGVDASRWQPVADVVHELLADARLSDRQRRQTRRPLAGLALFVAGQGHTDLTADLLLRPESIEGYVATVSHGSAATYRSALRRLADLHQPERAGLRHRITKRPGASPYHPDVVEQMLTFASALGNPLRRRRATGLALLGVGAGLDGRDLVDLRPVHVTTRPDGVVAVSVQGSRCPRTVAVHGRYAPRLLDLCAELDAGDQLVRSGNVRDVTGYAVRAFAEFEEEAVEVRRLRATFIALHLVGGTPIDVLARQAGTKSLRDIDPLLDTIASWDRLPGRDDDLTIAARAWPAEHDRD